MLSEKYAYTATTGVAAAGRGCTIDSLLHLAHHSGGSTAEVIAAQFKTVRENIVLLKQLGQLKVCFARPRIRSPAPAFLCCALARLFFKCML